MTSFENHEASIASVLLSIGAVSLQPSAPFTWTSGLRSPIYCDNRMLMGYPAERAQVTQAFVSVLESMSFHPDLIAGTATAGIPHAAWLAHATDLPMIYVRSSAKEYGRKKQVEGPVASGQSAIIIEDLVSTGKSSIGVVKALVEEGIKVRAVFSIFTYGFAHAQAAFDAASVPFYSLTNFTTLLEVAHQEHRISEQEYSALRDWHRDPEAWSHSFSNK